VKRSGMNWSGQPVSQGGPPSSVDNYWRQPSSLQLVPIHFGRRRFAPQDNNGQTGVSDPS